MNGVAPGLKAPLSSLLSEVIPLHRGQTYAGRTEEEFNSQPFDFGKNITDHKVGKDKQYGEFVSYFAKFKDDPRIKEAIDQFGPGTTFRNFLFYAPGSIMTWHTNSDCPGTRTYVSVSTGGSIFKYRNPNDFSLGYDFDNNGWTIRQFVIPEDKLFWHTIYARNPRFVFGFNTPIAHVIP
jgi:hypothetical protein